MSLSLSFDYIRNMTFSLLSFLLEEGLHLGKAVFASSWCLLSWSWGSWGCHSWYRFLSELGNWFLWVSLHDGLLWSSNFACFCFASWLSFFHWWGNSGTTSCWTIILERLKSSNSLLVFEDWDHIHGCTASSLEVIYEFISLTNANNWISFLWDIWHAVSLWVSSS